MPTNLRQWNSTLPQRRKPMARSSLKRQKNGLARHSTEFKKRSRKPAKKTLGAGQKTREWKDTRAKLKVVFAAAGITTCELRMEGCWRDNGLGFAHSLKRRFIVTPQQLEKVCLACNSCHDKIEVLPHAEMEAIVELVIESRSTPVETIFEKIEDGH